MSGEQAWNPKLYGEKHSFVWEMAEDLLGLLAARPREKILDVGCGSGEMTARIANSGAVVTAIDSSAEMIKQARLKFPEIRFEQMDAREIRFDAKFDAVFSNAALHWIPQPERVVIGIRGALRTGGRFVAEFGGRGNIAQLVEAISQAHAARGLDPEAWNPWYYPSAAEYARILDSRGFKTRLAMLFDRPTPLEDGERGLETWLRMFGGSFIAAMPAGERDAFVQDVIRLARPSLFRNRQWVLDYRRLRVIAAAV
ncbi:MAG TPA: class I SAM-dependent methyltransferase [Candidatus Acidoferrales bacterium]|nr:class I SAM-dependent methyltransferase [Candidatus Acidoferrales bacterium]